MEIIFEQLKNTGIIKLNRPKALNALNINMSENFSNYLNEWEQNDSIKQVLLTGEGKHFCAGGDVKSLVLADKTSSLKKKFFQSEYKLNYQISNFSKPYLSIWNGVVMGGGIGLSLYGNYRIVTDTTKLAMPETAIGFFPDVGGSYFLPRIKNNYGIFLGLTGHVLNLNEILNLGLGTHYCPNDKIQNLIDKYIDKEKILNFNPNPIVEKTIFENIDLIKNCFHGNINNIFKNLKTYGTETAIKYLETLKKKCPMSLAVTSELMTRGSNKKLSECLEMEYKLSQNMVYRNDFDEGINAVLISKNKNAKWKPLSVKEITKNDVNKLFELDKEILKL